MAPWEPVSVLAASPPYFSAEEAATIAAQLFDLHGHAVALGSERDQTFLIEGGKRGGVLKISNLGEEPPVLDLEEMALGHIGSVDLELPILRQRGRATVDGPGGPHFIRLFDRMQGRVGGPELGD